MTPLFSLCHATARPNAWRGSYDAWIARAANPELVEYVLCCDGEWFLPSEGILANELSKDGRGHLDKTVWNDGPKGCVRSWNAAAAASTGRILILNADDMRPPQDWDKALLKAIHQHFYAKTVAQSEPGSPAEFAALFNATDPLEKEFVVHVSVGGQADERGLIILQILSRGRYKRLGYALYPEYDGMYSDNEFQEHAKLDGSYIDARHLRWTHYHPFNGVGKMDDVYRHQNRPEAYEAGRALFEKRKAEGFPAWIWPYLDERSVDINSILDSEPSYKRERHK